MNANDKDARKLFDEYNCYGVPHLLFIDKDGKEVDRIIGYLPPSEYLLRIKDISNDNNKKLLLLHVSLIIGLINLIIELINFLN